MKKYIANTFSILFVFLLVTSCNHSYYSASTKNINRFDGEKEEVAEVLVKMNDYSMLFESMSSLAEDKASLKSTYLVADKMEDHFSDLKADIGFEAIKKRTTLADELSEELDDTYQKVFSADKDEFDVIYKRIMLDELNRFKEYLSRNLEDPTNEYVKELSNNYLSDVRMAIAEMNDLTT